MTTLKLAWRTLRVDRGRSAAAIIGIAASVALLAWHLGLASTSASQAELAILHATKPFSAWISGPPRSRTMQAPSVAANQHSSQPGHDANGSRATAEATVGFRRTAGDPGPIPPDLIDAFKDRSDIRTVPVAVAHAPLDVRPDGRVMQGPPLVASIAAMPESNAPLLESQRTLASGRWPEHDSQGSEAAFNEAIFKDRGLPVPQIGTKIPVILKNGTVVLEVSAIFSSSTAVKAFPSVYTTQTAMAGIAAATPGGLSCNLLLCEPLEGADVADVEHVLNSVPAAERCSLYTREKVADRFKSDTAGNIMRQLPLSLPLAVLTSVFMMLTALTSNLAENRRRIALLRCSGMTRGAVAATVLWETAIIAAAGWIVGMAVASALLQAFLVAENSPELPKIIHLGAATPAATALLSAIVAVLASLAPVMMASKVRPLEAVAPGDTSRPRRISVRKTFAGLMLMLVMPALALPQGMAASTRAALFVAFAMPCFAVGCFLCQHALMAIVETVTMKPIARLLRIDPLLLSRRISRAPGRAVGTIMTISLGLGAYMAIHIWGASLMASYVPSPEWPDAIVSMLPNGIAHATFEDVKNAPGIDTEALPIEASQFELAPETIDAISKRGLPASNSNLLLVFGVDPDAAFGGDHPFADFIFVQGSRDEAVEAMRDSDACVVPLMFTRLTGLHKGDSFTIAGRKLEICGVVDLNWHLVTSRAQVRTLFGRLDASAAGRGGTPRKPTMGMAFTSEKFARSLTGNANKINFAWLNLDRELGAMHPLQAAIRLDASLNKAIAASHASRGGEDERNALKVHHRDEIADGTIAHGNSILGTMARIPFWSLVITASGIGAMLFASAQANKAETSMMRAVGMTRGQLASVFLGEAAFAIICAIVTSLVLGILAGWSFTAVTRTRLAAGLSDSISMPWPALCRGVALMLVCSLVAAVIPLRSITRDSPMR